MPAVITQVLDIEENIWSPRFDTYFCFPIISYILFCTFLLPIEIILFIFLLRFFFHATLHLNIGFCHLSIILAIQNSICALHENATANAFWDVKCMFMLPISYGSFC